MAAGLIVRRQEEIPVHSPKEADNNGSNEKSRRKKENPAKCPE